MKSVSEAKALTILFRPDLTRSGLPPEDAHSKPPQTIINETRVVMITLR